ncbi:Regulator of RpoS [Emticicia aquatica]|jgi:PAS domain S-box-containing protein|uniref:Regulator of RpoS n=1 Tax=Emticicia aquatica TaxID=1681835 RepID=A0ABM9AM02_9BACT|nr:histidine kinase [Emticicia aquatica]CAH0994811.1 Regulator of RpoS [Emticicia aquatica]
MIKDKKPYNLLIIEDNIGDFILISDYLSEVMDNVRITQAKNFRDSKNILQDSGNKFDVILLDLTLPDNKGEVLISEIIDLAFDCPVLVLTGYTDIEFSIKSLSLGVSDYLIKEDIRVSSLYKSILYAIERKKTILELEASEKRYSDLFHLSPLPKWVYNQSEKRFMQVNQAAINKYGYSEEELLSMTFIDIGDEIEGQQLMEILNKDESTQGNIFVGRYKHFKKSKEEIDVEIYCNQIVLNQSICKSIIAFDITDKIQIINSLRLEKQQSARFQSQLLSSQLNPHFIFNTLNSFQYYILKGEIEESIQNIAEFSKLMRQVLENSDSTFISFFDEIKFINTYINISKKRLPQSLDFSIQISDGFHLKSQFIPPMLLQPYVENAIKHGFTNPAIVSKLSIEISQSNGVITCKIKDNGVGRVESQLAKNILGEPHKKSMAMGINHKRIDLLNESTDRNFQVKVIDCYDNQNQATGTEVIISFEQITDEMI